jgi:hypothetical protein
MGASEKFEKLKLLFPDAELKQEGGAAIAFLPRLVIDNQGKRVTVKALLWPYPRDSYTSRLFLDQKLDAPKARNWKAFVIGGATWWACSWQGVPNEGSWAEILAGHLGAFK